MLERNDYTYNNAGMRLTNAISDANGPVRTEQYGRGRLTHRADMTGITGRCGRPSGPFREQPLS